MDEHRQIEETVDFAAWYQRAAAKVEGFCTNETIAPRDVDDAMNWACIQVGLHRNRGLPPPTLERALQLREKALHVYDQHPDWSVHRRSLIVLWLDNYLRFAVPSS
jgi:hypothetical protein